MTARQQAVTWGRRLAAMTWKEILQLSRDVRESIRNACLIRLRPVVMTMVATVLGGLPLILRGGAGSEARTALGATLRPRLGGERVGAPTELPPQPPATDGEHDEPDDCDS